MKYSNRRMASNKFSELVQKSWPEYEYQPEEFQNQLSFILAVILFLFPVFILVTVWLILVSDWTTLQTQALLLLFLAVAILIIEQNPYTIIIRLGQGLQVPLSSSLSSILLPAAMLIWGPSVFWIAWLSGFLSAGKQYLDIRSRALVAPGWLPLNSIVQVSGISVLQLLITSTIYEQLGGAYPLATTSREQLLPAFVAVFISVFLSAILFAPLLVIINRVAGDAFYIFSMVGFMGAVVGTSFVTQPFAIPLALSYSMMGMGIFVFLCIGVLLTQMLAASLSRSNLRNQARARELSTLESLSKEIIQAPVDASTLADLVKAHIESLFSRGRVMIRLFPPDGNEGGGQRPYFTITNPPDVAVEDAVWQTLQQAQEDYIILPKQKLPDGKRHFGDLFLVKITVPDNDGTPECVGGIYAHQPRSLRSAEERLPTLLELAGQIGAGLYRAQVHIETLAFHRVTQELAFAGRIQASFLPKEIPQIAGWDLTATIIPARQTSGDFYDFVALENGRIGFVVADVADKGTGAALYMALSRTLIRTYAMQFPDEPGKALQAANERILSDTESDQFVTVFYGVLDPETGRMIYANAGHNPPLITGSQSLALTKTGIPLGMFEDMAWESAQAQLAPGDTVTMFTDGIPEAQNLGEEEFGDARLLDVLNNSQGCGTEEMASALITAVQSFTDTAPQFDDITLVILKRNN